MPLGKLFTESRSLLVLKRTAVTSVSVLAIASVSLAPVAFALQTGDSVTYEYDELGRLKQADYSNQATISYGMDAAGNRTQVSVTGLPAATFWIDDIQINEGAGVLEFTVQRSGDLGADYTIDFATADGANVSGDDYTPNSGSLQFLNGSTAETVSVTVVDDDTFEPSEVVLLNLSNIQNLTNPGDIGTMTDAQAAGTIIDDDASVSLSVSDASPVNEEMGLVYTVTRSGNTAQEVTLNYETVAETGAGKATSGTDYTAVANGAYTFLAGETTKTITVATVEDGTGEASESVKLQISSPTYGVTVTDSEGVGTIVDPPSFSVTGSSVTEAGGSQLMFTVTRTGATYQDYTINYATADGGSNGATAGADYTALPSAPLTFPASVVASSSLNIPNVTVLDDGLYEGSETVLLTLTNPTPANGVSLANGSATITDNEGPPVLSVETPASASEGEGLVFRIVRSGNLDQTVDINYVAQAGTASVSDYTATSGAYTFASGQTEHFVTVPTLVDGGNESDETVLLNVTSSTYGVQNPADGVGTIYDAPSFSINDVTVPENSSGTFTVTKTGPTTKPYTVNFAVTPWDAEADDYSTPYAGNAGSLTFPASAGNDTQTITLTATSDAIDEYNDRVYVDLSNPSGGAHLGDSQGVGTITDDPADGPPSFSVNDVSASEGGALTFTITKTGTSDKTFTVTYDAQNGSASAADYTDTSGTRVFTSSTTTQQVNVSTVNDTIDEDAQTVNLKLTGVDNGGTFTDDTGVGTILVDATDPLPSFKINNQTVTEGAVITMTVTKTGVTEKTYTVDYNTRNSSAVAGSDYTAASGTLSFSSGQGTRTFNVTTTQDGLDEAQERIWLDLTNVSGGATISDNLGQGKINDDDESPVAVDDATSMSAGLYQDLDVRLNDSDGDGDSLTVTSVTQPGNASVIIQSNNVLRIIAGSSGTSTFTYTVTDGNGNYDTGTVTVTVNGGGGGPPLF